MKKGLIGLLAGLLILCGCSSVKFESSYEGADAYFKYMEKAEGNDDLIEGYIDESDEGYMVDLYNGDDCFWMGETVLMSEQEKQIGSYTTTLVRPQGYYYSFDLFEEEPATFVLKDSQFFTFTYPNTEFEYEAVYDITSDYSEEWYNILLKDNCTLENVKTAAEYQYAVNVVTDEYYHTYYFYDNSMQTYFDQEYEQDYPDSDSAIYGAGMDFENKTITVYQNSDEGWIELEVLTMD